MSRNSLSECLFVLFLFVSMPLVGAVIEKGTIPIYAVTSTDEALRAELIIEVVPGSGKIWSSVEPLVGTSTQHTERVSVELAKNYFDRVGDYDYKFDINSSASVVEGPSAGAAMALLLISMLQDRKLPEYVAITGQIAEDGSIGTVGGVFEKAQEASETGIKVFLIPRGEGYQMHRFPDGVKTVNLIEYAFGEWGMKVIEVSNIDEALELAFTKPEEIDVNRKVERGPEIFVPKGIEIKPALEPMKKLTEKYLKKAEKRIEAAKDALNNSPLEDPAIISILLDSLSGSEKTIERAKLLFEKNYLYSTANYAFLAIVNADLVKDLSENPSLIDPNSTLLEMRASDLGEQILLLEKDLNSFYSAENLEWIIAAKQRLSWAKLNVKNIIKTKTIVISANGRGISDAGIAIENLRNYEYAKEWFNAAKDFWEIARGAKDKIQPVPILRDKANDYIVAAENELALMPHNDTQDIERRLSAARLARGIGWNDSAAFDAASALALAKAEKEIKGKSLKELMALLGGKLSKLEYQVSKSNTAFVWPQLYLDHARYFFDSAQYFDEEKDLSNALENAKSGLRLAFFAEEMIVVTKQARNELESFPVVEEFHEEEAKPLIQEIPLYPLLAMLVVVAVVTFLLVWRSWITPAGEPQEAIISRRMERLEKLKHQTETARLRNRLSEEEYRKLAASYEQQLKALEEERRQRSKHLIEIDKLHGEIEMIQYMLKELKRQYREGEIVDKDYREILNSLSQRLVAVKTEAGKEEAELSEERQKIARLKKRIAERKAKAAPKTRKRKAKKGSKKA